MECWNSPSLPCYIFKFLDDFEKWALGQLTILGTISVTTHPSVFWRPQVSHKACKKIWGFFCVCMCLWFGFLILSLFVGCSSIFFFLCLRFLELSFCSKGHQALTKHLSCCLKIWSCWIHIAVSHNMTVWFSDYSLMTVIRKKHLLINGVHIFHF